MRRQNDGARVRRIRVDTQPAELVVEADTYARCSRAARQPEASQGAQTAYAQAPTHSQAHLAIDEMDEGQTLIGELAGDLVSMTAGSKDLALLQELEPLTPIGLHMTEQKETRGRQPRQEVLHHEIAVGRNERRGIRTKHLRSWHGVGTTPGPPRRGRGTRPSQNLFGEEPPFAADAVPREAPAQQSVDMLRVNAQKSRHLRCGEQGLPAMNVLR